MLKKILSAFAALLSLLLLYIIVDTGPSLKLPDATAKELKIPYAELRKEAVPILQDLLRMKTIRSNEIVAAEYLKNLLEKEGIPARIYAKAGHPTRANLVAELVPEQPGNEGIILASHLDVVEANSEEWQVDPFSGLLKDNKIWGRGAIDMKGHTVMELMTFLYLKRNSIKLKNKVMFLAVADEETLFDYGSRFMLQEHKDIFKGYRYVLNEGGLGTRDVAIKGSKIFNIQFGEKGLLWLRLEAEGESSHGSRPPLEYALKSMTAFMTELQAMETGVTIVPQTESFFYQMGQASSFPNSFFLKRAANPLIKPLITPTIRSNRYLTAMTANTRAMTALYTNEDKGPNVIASKAYAMLDMRLLPTETPDSYKAKIAALGKKHGVRITEELSRIEPNTSPTDSPFFMALAGTAMNAVPGSIVTPLLTPGNTDNTIFRQLGLFCYGLTPVMLDESELGSTHSKNEYMSLENLELGIKIMLETMVAMN